MPLHASPAPAGPLLLAVSGQTLVAAAPLRPSDTRIDAVASGVRLRHLLAKVLPGARADS
ncbi:hypothetical protein [Streptomyces sp. NPDC051561]|uniref:hypothetical protein n=1 Tax=Streptomyces sp. NPDC051561 TaxID=3365658 RepID=UPI0037BE1E12